eukprot:UN07123
MVFVLIFFITAHLVGVGHAKTEVVGAGFVGALKGRSDTVLYVEIVGVVDFGKRQVKEREVEREFVVVGVGETTGQARRFVTWCLGSKVAVLYRAFVPVDTAAVSPGFIGAKLETDAIDVRILVVARVP